MLEHAPVTRPPWTDHTNTRHGLENTLYPAEAAPAAMGSFASLLGMLCVQAGGRIRYAPDTFCLCAGHDPAFKSIIFNGGINETG